MDSEKLLQWLMNEKNMSRRAAKDVLSRCGRIYRMLDIQELSDATMAQLIACAPYQACSMFVKSQLKRAVTLCLEYQHGSGAHEGDRHEKIQHC